MENKYYATTKLTEDHMERREYETETGKCVSIGWGKVNPVSMDKSYVAELYCREFCRGYYTFGCDWDRRCSKNDKPIHQAVKDCPKFKQAKIRADELRKKINEDKDFARFCAIKNMNMCHTGFCGNRTYDLETFLGIFNE